MNILVIGNGFDLEHGLPTKYSDFILYIKEEKYKNIKEFIIKEEFIDLITNNLWVEYFIDLIEPNKGWIDFESEMSALIQCLDYLRDKKINLYDHEHKIAKEKFENKTTMNGPTLFEIYAKRIPKRLKEIFEQPDISFFSNKYKEFVISPLYVDLKKLIRALEIYLEVIPESKQCDIISPDIFGKKYDNVLSFNYTSTYEKVYERVDENKRANEVKDKDVINDKDTNKKSIAYNFIHGKAKLYHSIEKNNMVLGIDEYLTTKSKDKETDFIDFKKYFQRTLKNTDSIYKDWINIIKEDKDTMHYIDIFGHSLDITDKEVLKEMLELDNVKTTIYYYNEDAHKNLLVNLVKILGQEQLLQRCNGANPMIEFKQQTPRCFLYRRGADQGCISDFLNQWSRVFKKYVRVKIDGYDSHWNLSLFNEEGEKMVFNDMSDFYRDSILSKALIKNAESE